MEYDSCEINYLSLNNISSHLSIINSNVKVLSILNSKDCDIQIEGNPYLHAFRILNSKNVSLTLNENEFSDSSFVVFSDCSFTKLFFIPSYIKSSVCDFSNDTILNQVQWTIIPFQDSLTATQKNKTSHTFRFHNCYINADFFNFGQFYNCNLEFDNCTFGPNTYFGTLAVSKLRFSNCKVLSTSIPLNFISESDKVEITITNTDFTNFRFNLNQNIHLTFDSTTMKDVCFNTFESLLNKFRDEGKHDSYQILDIQYKNFKNSSIVNWLDKNWWYYGYKKELVIKWIIIFLFIFTFLNLIFWDKIKTAYPIIEEEKENYFYQAKLVNQIRMLLKRVFTVFIFTSFIFFSINLSFSKFSYRKTFPLAWILFQYIIGLICIFFAANYLFKL